MCVCAAELWVCRDRVDRVVRAYLLRLGIDPQVSCVVCE